MIQFDLNKNQALERKGKTYFESNAFTKIKI